MPPYLDLPLSTNVAHVTSRDPRHRPLHRASAEDEVDHLAHAVLLPAIADLDLRPVRTLFERGCRAVLLGETREEYLARSMSDVRRSHETAEAVRAIADSLLAYGHRAVIVAADHEFPGICRFEHLLPVPPSAPTGGETPREVEVMAHAAAVGRALGAMGVNVTLGPILDVVRGANPWLHRRNAGRDPATVAAVGRAMVAGLQASGVSAVAKHFPGHAEVPDDPAVSAAVVRTPLAELDLVDAAPFRAAIKAGVRGIMLGPAVIEALDPSAPASLSPIVVRHARDTFGFDGVLVTDDLDAVSILGRRPIGRVAVDAVSAGADLLLTGAHAAAECADALAQAVRTGDLELQRLTQAARRIDRLARIVRPPASLPAC